MLRDDQNEREAKATPDKQTRRGIRRWRPWILLFGVAVVALCATVTLVWQDVALGTVPSLPELDRRVVELRGDRTYRPGDTEPFSGWLVDYDAEGTLKSRSAMSQGRLHGLSEGWFPDGSLQISEYFVEGISDGSRTKWHSSGAKQSEALVRAGKIEGLFRRWDEQGNLVAEITLKAGIPNGLSRSWYPGGTLKAEVMMAAGRVEHQQFWPEDAEAPR